MFPFSICVVYQLQVHSSGFNRPVAKRLNFMWSVKQYAIQICGDFMKCSVFIVVVRYTKCCSAVCPSF